MTNKKEVEHLISLFYNFVKYCFDSAINIIPKATGRVKNYVVLTIVFVLLFVGLGASVTIFDLAGQKAIGTSCLALFPFLEWGYILILIGEVVSEILNIIAGNRYQRKSAGTRRQNRYVNTDFSNDESLVLVRLSEWEREPLTPRNKKISDLSKEIELPLDNTMTAISSLKGKRAVVVQSPILHNSTIRINKEFFRANMRLIDSLSDK